MSESLSESPLWLWWRMIGIIILAIVITMILALILTVLSTMVAFLISFGVFIINEGLGRSPLPNRIAGITDLVLACLAGFIGGALAGQITYRFVLASTLPQATWWAWASALIWGIGLIPFWYDFMYNSRFGSNWIM